MKGVLTLAIYMALGVILVGSLGIWASSAEGQASYEDELIAINVRADTAEEMKAIWEVSWAGIEELQAQEAGRPRTGFEAFDAVGERFGLLWIQRAYGSWSSEVARRIYVLHFPEDSATEEIEGAYGALPFLQAVAVGRIPEEWLIEDPGPHGRYNEKVLVIVRSEAEAEIEAIWGGSSLHEQEALELGIHTGIEAFDAVGERFGLLWIERTYGDKQLYGLHFPLGKSVQVIMAAYTELPFIEYAGPAYVPIELADDTAAENMTWGRIKGRISDYGAEGTYATAGAPTAVGVRMWP